MNKRILIWGLLVFLKCIVVAQVPVAGLAGYWPFHINANDSSGNGNHGTVNGPVLVKDRFGNCQQAYYFNGINANQIVVPNSPAINFNNSTDFSVAFWAKNDPANFDGIPISKNQYGSFSGYQFFASSDNSGYCNVLDHTTFYVASGAGQDACSDNALDTNWHFFAGIYKYASNQSFLYVDGVLQGDVGARSGNMSTAANLYFGANMVGANKYTGTLDAIRIYNRALNQTEITQLYNEPNPGSAVTAPTISATSATICPGQTATLTVSGASSYTWSGGIGASSDTVTVSPTQTTTYSVFAGSGGCVGMSTATVSMKEILVSVNSETICTPQTVTLTAEGALSYTWSAAATPVGSNTALVYPFSTTSYTVTGEQDGCVASAVASVTIMETGQFETLIVPNTFTPNNDHVNDYFEVKAKEQGYAISEFKIYNRWGTLVYSASDPVKWDGKQKQGLIDDGTYFWVAVYSSLCDLSKADATKSGFLTIFR